MNMICHEEEFMVSGHAACPGCGAMLALRYALKALGERTMVTITACCASVVASVFPYTDLKVPLLNCAFATTGATASGIKAGLEMKGDTETTVLAWAGDGGTFDIGIQSLSGAAERNEDFIFVCYDNEAYMNTGTQRSSASPQYVWTTTTPTSAPKSQLKKDIMGIMLAHHIPYLATASIAYPEDFMAKMRKARAIHGTRFFHILSPCPAGWRYPSEFTIKLARLAVQSRLFPLYEIENGKYGLTAMPEKVPVADYLKPQGRFRHLTGDMIAAIQHNADADWESLLRKTGDIPSCV